MSDASLAPAALVERPGGAVPVALVEACGLPSVGSRLGELAVRVGTGARPVVLDGSVIVLSATVAAHTGSAAIALREAVELAALGGTGWPERILAHALAVTYAGTVLRSEVGAGPPVGGLLAPDVDPDLVDRAPEEAAARIAAFLTTRDREPCPPHAIATAARALPLACPTEVLLCRGGDHRQRVDWSTGRNSYGLAARPNPWTASFGSCTASAPTFRAFDAARRARLRLARAALDGHLAETVADEAATVRNLLASALGAEDVDAEVVLTPSGTDAELVALAVALAPGGALTSILVGPTELGRGSLPAAGGHHFSDQLPSGAPARAGDRIEGLAEGAVEVRTIPVRDDEGAPRTVAAIREHIDAELAGRSGRLLLHVVEGSKTGIRAPRSADVERWESRFGEHLDVVVDAAQMRVDQATVVGHLRRGRMVLVTGSKFFGGPPFSGAVLVPRALARRLGPGVTLPPGLGGYLAEADVPSGLPALRAVARPGANLGLLVRWVAALAEMRAFHNASTGIRDEVVRRLAVGVRRTIESSPYVSIVESPFTVLPAHDERGFDDLPTIFTFTVTGPDGRPLEMEQARTLQHWLVRDATPLVGPVEAAHQVARRSFHLGQPVALYRSGGRDVAGLRLAIGAATISRIVFDHTRGASWADRAAAELADMRDALDKLALVLPHLADP